MTSDSTRLTASTTASKTPSRPTVSNDASAPGGANSSPVERTGARASTAAVGSRVGLSGTRTDTSGSRRSSARRRYDDGCAAAHALDLIGERWALLVVRELLLGPRRFSDLRDALASISPNVLTQRLGDLEAAGVVQRRVLAPPAASRVYMLTPWGAQLETVILELLKWGVRSPGFERGRALTPDAMALSLKGLFRPELAGSRTCRVTLYMHNNAYHVAIGRGQLALARGEPPCHPGQAAAWAQVSLHANPVVVLKLAYGKYPLPEALAQGLCHLEGDPEALQYFFSCFEVAPPVGGAELAGARISGTTGPGARQSR